DRLHQFLRRGTRRLVARGGRTVVGERAHRQFGQATVDTGPYLVGRDQPDVLRQAGHAVGVALVGPALGERRVEQGTDGLRVGALRGVGADVPQRRVDGETADAPLAGRGAQDGVGVQ